MGCGFDPRVLRSANPLETKGLRESENEGSCSGQYSICPECRSLADSVADCHRSLKLIAEAWPQLPSDIRSAIETLVKHSVDQLLVETAGELNKQGEPND